MSKMETMNLSEIEADAGGKALCEKQMAGRITRPWHQMLRSERRKWTESARVVIDVAKEAVAAAGHVA